MFMKLKQIEHILSQFASSGSKFSISFNPVFLKWTLPFLNLDLSTDANIGFSLNNRQKQRTHFGLSQWAQ